MKSPRGDRASAVRLLPHIAAAGVFVALAVVWTFPLVLHLSTHVPGPVPGDNVGFLWNFWWMRTALASGLNFFYTPYLFVPAGADLTLHTHSALPAFVGATVLATLLLITAENLAILTALFLNGFCAYLLAWRLTRDHAAAIIGGLVYGGSPYIAAHLNEHFNLIAAWTIPLFAMTASDAIRGSTRAAIMAGLVAGLTAYIDYYYVVFEFALVACLAVIAAVHWSVAWNGAGPRARRMATLVGLLLVVDIGVIVAVTATGGFDARIGPIRVSAHEIFNPLQALWILLGLFLALRLGPRITVSPLATPTLARVVRAMPIILAAFLIGAAPIVWNGVALIARGEYVSQPYFWRSAPRGIDLATLVLGHPFHGVWGESVRDMYRALGIDAIESIGWLGVTPLVLAAWALRGARRRALADSGSAGGDVQRPRYCVNGP